MIAFFGGRPAQRVPRFRRPGGQRLPVIEALGRDFPGVIDPHEARGMAAPGRIDRCRRAGFPGVGRLLAGLAKLAAQAAIGQFQQAVEGGEDARVHATHII